MALVKCRECFKQISNLAVTCPHCGAPGYATPAQSTGAAVTPPAKRVVAPPPPRVPAQPMPKPVKIALAVVGGLGVLVGVLNFKSLRPATYQEQIAEVRKQRLAREAAQQAKFDQVKPALITEAKSDIKFRRFYEVIGDLEPWQQQMDAETRALYQSALDATAPEREAKKLAEEKRLAEVAAAAAKVKAAADAQIARIGEQPEQSAWDGSYYEVERYLKRVAHDPDSIDVSACTKAVPTEKGWAIRCEYRGKNAFGGLILKNGLFVVKHGAVVSAADL